MNIGTLNNVKALLGKISVTKLDMGALRSIVTFQKNVSNEIESFQSAQKFLIEEYDIKQTKQGMLDIDSHSKKDEIIKKLEELSQLEYEVAGGGFMTEEDFFNSVQSTLNVNEISVLFDHLVIQEKPEAKAKK